MANEPEDKPLCTGGTEDVATLIAHSEGLVASLREIGIEASYELSVTSVVHCAGKKKARIFIGCSPSGVGFTVAIGDGMPHFCYGVKALIDWLSKSEPQILIPGDG